MNVPSDTVIHIETDPPPTPENGWAPLKVRRLREWQQRCKRQSFAHMMSGDYYSTMFMLINIPSIVLTATATLFNGAALLSQDNAVPLTLIALLSSAIATILAGILQSTDPSQIAAAHAALAAGYERIILQINAELTNDIKDRINGVRFIRQISNSMTQLATGAVQIPLRIWNRVDRHIKDLDLRGVTADGDNAPDMSGVAGAFTSDAPAQSAVVVARKISKAAGAGAAAAVVGPSIVMDVSGSAASSECPPTPNDSTPLRVPTMDTSGNVMPRAEFRAQPVGDARQWLFDFQNSRYMWINDS